MVSTAEKTLIEIQKLNRAISELSLRLLSAPNPVIPPQARLVARAVEPFQDTILTTREEIEMDALRRVQDSLRGLEVDFTQPAPLGGIGMPVQPAVKKKRSTAQKKNDKLQSKAFQQANAEMRKKNGTMRKGKTQSDVAKRAQKILKVLKKNPTYRAGQAIKKRLK